MKVLDTVEVIVRLKEKIADAKTKSNNSLVHRLEALLEEVLRDPKKSHI